MQHREGGLTPEPAERPPADDAVAATGDILAGALFAGVGLLALYIGYGYPAGSALDMGPGYLPRIVAGALVLIGVALVARGARRHAWALPPFPVRSMIWIGAAILLFAFLVERVGLFLACLACVLVAAAADAQARWREAPVVAVLLAAFCALLFGYVLKLSVRIWPL
jgi:hypothetical protein